MGWLPKKGDKHPTLLVGHDTLYYFTPKATEYS